MVCLSATQKVPRMPLGEMLTWPAGPSHAVPTKNIGWAAMNSMVFGSRAFFTLAMETPARAQNWLLALLADGAQERLPGRPFIGHRACAAPGHEPCERRVVE